MKGVQAVKLPDLSDLALPGAEIVLRVTPNAARASVVRDGDVIRISVTVTPEKGKANAAVLKLLAKALGVPKTSLSIIRGGTGRDKLVRVSG